MNKHSKPSITLSFLLVFLFFVGIPKGNTANNLEIPLAKKGILRLDAQNIEEGIELNGEWEFYWKELVTPQDFKTNTELKPLYFTLPSTWNQYKIEGNELGSKGFATYRLLIETPTVNNLLALEIPAFYNSYKLWVNGTLLSENGKVGVSQETSIAQWLAQTRVFNLEGNSIEIIIQVSNFRHVNGGFYKIPKLGMYQDLSRLKEFSVGVDLMVFGCLFLIGFFFLGMYFFWRNDKSLLYFALFCIIISYRFIGTENYVIINIFPDAPWAFMAKLEYISMYGGIALLITFIAELFPKAVYLLLIRVFQYLSAFLILFTLLFPISIYSYTIVPYQIVFLIYLAYGFFICIKAQSLKYDGAIFGIISIVVLLLTSAISSLSYLGILPHFAFTFQIGFLFFVFSQMFILSFRFAKAFHQVENLKEETLEQTKEILLINETIQEKNQHIMDSIRYAKTIQSAFLVQDKEMERLFSDYFTLYKPKDVVSGDFYWVKEMEDKLFFVVADCTGHGVPGAFMSIIGITLLNEIVEVRNLYNPAEILENLHLGIVSSLKQNDSTNKDGMDIGLCVIEKEGEDSFKITFTGAKIPLYYSVGGVFDYIGGSRKRVGGTAFKRAGDVFKVHELTVPKGSYLYLASDGFQDQNNNKGKRFSSKNFRQTLEEISQIAMDKQGEELEKILAEHQTTEDQRDDITVVGLQL